MKFVQTLSFVLSFTLLNSVKSDKICDYSDIVCTTKGAQNVFKSLVSGSQDKTNPLDPLHLKKLEGEYLALKYEISDGSLTGFSNCQVTRLKLTDKESTFQIDVQCPRLVLSHNHVIVGKWGLAEVDSNGPINITFNDYTIKFKGKFGGFISAKDNKLYYYHLYYDTEFEPKGTVAIESGPLHSDPEKAQLAEAFLSENLMDAEKLFRFPILETYMAKVMNVLETHLRNVPVEVLIPADYK